MNVTYNDQTRQRAEDHLLLEQATKILEKIVNPDLGKFSAQWDWSQDQRGHPIYSLTLSDGTEAVSATFTPDELGQPNHMRSRFRDLWDDLLQLQSKKRIKRLLQYLAEEE
ncbi:MAG: hypothetical protein HYS12_10385 [Planctomycetes bacterium]|nr:hypothetical protein [Planctomycetota bacterium]